MPLQDRYKIKARPTQVNTETKNETMCPCSPRALCYSSGFPMHSHAGRNFFLSNLVLVKSKDNTSTILTLGQEQDHVYWDCGVEGMYSSGLQYHPPNSPWRRMLILRAPTAPSIPPGTWKWPEPDGQWPTGEVAWGSHSARQGLFSPSSLALRRGHMDITCLLLSHTDSEIDILWPESKN